MGTAATLNIATESAVARAGLICSSREDYKARLWQCPAEPQLTLSKGQAIEPARALTPPKFIILGLVSSTASISSPSQRWLAPSVNMFAFSPQPEPSEALSPLHTALNGQSNKGKVSQKSTSCVSIHSFLSESSLTEEASQDEQQPRNSTMFPNPVERSSGTRISVPGGVLRNIRRYREDYDAYLRVVAHEAVGGFNPWAVANR